jgi:hypothetical protein
VTAFRLLTMDLLELFKVMNEGTINVLEHYFEMSRPDAERSLSIYKTFGRQTEQVVQYLSLARQYETSTRLEVPRLKHAPTTLTSSLEDYLNDPDFEINRRQYLAQQEAKRSGRALPTPQATSKSQGKTSRSDPFSSSATTNPPTTSKQPAKGPPPDLIDFFDSIESNQQPMANQNQPAQSYAPDPGFQQQQFQPQQTGYNPFLQQSTGQQYPPQQFQQPQGPQYQQQQFSPQQQMQPVQTDFTGAGFGGYTAQSNGSQGQQPYPVQSPLSIIPQNGIAEFHQPPQPLQPQQTSTNPFRQSSMPTGFAATSLSPATQTPNRLSTNPFAKGPVHSQSAGVPAVANEFFGSTAFGSPHQTQQQDFQSHSALFAGATSPPQQSQQASPAPMQPQRTGTNPFAKNRSPPPAVAPLIANPTGSTNPFRQSAFVNQQTGQGWQRSDQGVFGNVETVPIFPRPGQN